jgi:hypothetical protein
MRLFGNMTKYDEREMVGCGAVYGCFLAFQALLEWFLKYGPVNEQKEASDHQHGQSIDRGNTIDTLILNSGSAKTRLPFPPDNFELIDWHGGRRDSRPPDDFFLTYKTRPEWMMIFLEGWMARLLACASILSDLDKSAMSALARFTYWLMGSWIMWLISLTACPNSKSITHH